MNLFGLIKNSRHWAEVLIDNAPNSALREYMRIVVGEFIMPDKIQETLFLSNYRYLSDDLNIKGITKSIHNFSGINIPLGYDKWFVAAYPDVANWFQDLDDKKAKSVLENVDESELMNDEHKIRPEFLRKIVNSYLNAGNNLECSK